MTQKKILMVTTIDRTLEAFLLPFADHFRQQGMQVDCMASGVLDNRALPDHFDHCYEIGWSRHLAGNLKLWPLLTQIGETVERNGYDIVHVHTPIASLLVRFALRNLRRRTKLRVVYTAHGFHFCSSNPWYKNLVFKMIERCASRWTDCIIIINHEDEQACYEKLQLTRDKVRRLPGVGVDTHAYPLSVGRGDREHWLASLDVATDMTVVLMVAEFNPGKRHGDALAALSQLNNPKVLLVFVGSGLLEEQVQALSRRLNLESQVRFLGFRNDVPRLLAFADIVLLPSIREGLPRIAMEAMASGVPVIGYQIRGMSDLFAKGGGLLSPVGDIAELADNLWRLVVDIQYRQHLGRQAQDIIRRYDVQQVIAEHDNLYLDLLNRQKSE